MIKKQKKTSECMKKAGVREIVKIYTRVFECIKLNRVYKEIAGIYTHGFEYVKNKWV